MTGGIGSWVALVEHAVMITGFVFVMMLVVEYLNVLTSGAWASLEDGAPHGIEIRLARPMKGGRLQITWAFDRNNPDHGHWYASRNYGIQVKSKAGDPWKTVADVKGNQSTVSSHPLPKEPFGFLRIYQLSGGGDPSRPNIMWVGQIEFVE